MNEIEIKVEKIRSYQTLTYKNGFKSFRKKEYTDYIKEISCQLIGFKKVKDNRDLKVYIEFRNKNKVLGDIDNIIKPILDLLQINEIIKNDKQITELHCKKSFNNKENSILIKIEEL